MRIDDATPCRIVSLIAENIKRLKAVEITPTGNIVEIAGANGQGKTSILDAIWWALKGGKAIQSAPIRDGADRAMITLDMGEFTVTRKFARKEGTEFTTSLRVETADGAILKSPQTILDGFLDTLTIDPLAFARMGAREQFDALRRFVPDFDFPLAEGQNRKDMEDRATQTRIAERAEAAAGLIEADSEFVTIDESSIINELTEISATNQELTARQARRDELAAKIAGWKTERAGVLNTIAELEAKARELADEIEFNEERLNKAEPLPALADAGEITKRLNEARAHNAKGERLRERAKLVAEATEARADADKITARMKAREEAKRAAIMAAKLPVESLGFGDGMILLDGQPFEQASDAEQLRASVAIAMAGNPKIRVIRVRDGSLLDHNAMGLLAEMAEKYGFQVWVERVDTSGKSGFVIEDGEVVATHAEAAE